MSGNFSLSRRPQYVDKLEVCRTLVLHTKRAYANDSEVHYKSDPAALAILRKGSATTFAHVPFGYLAPKTLETVFVGVVPSNAAVTLRTIRLRSKRFAGPAVATYVDGLGQEIEYRNQHAGSKTDLYVTAYSETL